VIGPGSTIGPDAVIEESVLLARCKVGARARMRQAILGAGVELADDAQIEPGTVIGDGELVGAPT
jgi:NDP-sugar pyrophosphorylase family protein